MKLTLFSKVESGNSKCTKWRKFSDSWTVRIHHHLGLLTYQLFQCPGSPRFSPGLNPPACRVSTVTFNYPQVCAHSVHVNCPVWDKEKSWTSSPPKCGFEYIWGATLLVQWLNVQSHLIFVPMWELWCISVSVLQDAHFAKCLEMGPAPPLENIFLKKAHWLWETACLQSHVLLQLL